VNNWFLKREVRALMIFFVRERQRLCILLVFNYLNFNCSHASEKQRLIKRVIYSFGLSSR